MKKKQYYILFTFLLVLVIVALLFLSNSFMVRSAICSLRSTDHFTTLETDSRILYEPGAREFAEQMAQLLPQAIEKVEKGQYRPFIKPLIIYICASEQSYTNLTGIKAPASLTLKGVFFSPRLIKEQRPLLLYLTHELSHLHIGQQVGKYKNAKLPAWFKEGLATLVSGGGGAHKVTEFEAIKAIKAGKHFEPHENGSIIFPKYGYYWDLPPQMFYKQCMMFVAYLKAVGEEKYCSFLLNIQDGITFSESFDRAFDLSLNESWENFLVKIESNKEVEQS